PATRSLLHSMESTRAPPPTVHGAHTDWGTAAPALEHFRSHPEPRIPSMPHCPNPSSVTSTEYACSTATGPPARAGCRLLPHHAAWIAPQRRLAADVLTGQCAARARLRLYSYAGSATRTAHARPHHAFHQASAKLQTSCEVQFTT